jgi:hypothetical protein
LKDLLDAAYFTGGALSVTLLAVSIEQPNGIGMELSSAIAEVVPRITEMVMQELHYSPTPA